MGVLRYIMADRVVIGMTGASGQIYGIRALEMLSKTDVETHLVLSDSAKLNIEQEAGHDTSYVEDLPEHLYSHGNVGAPVASGSFDTNGMLIVPCSMKTLSHIAYGNAGNLITRAADVMLKERRTLGVMPREKPLNKIHLKNMLEVTDAGGMVIPPFPSFYQNPESIDEMVSRTVARALEYLDIEVGYDEWDGVSQQAFSEGEKSVHSRS
jgi:4-hydroxy-3-polyprenylbenzoate decarboxylase